MKLKDWSHVLAARWSTRLKRKPQPQSIYHCAWCRLRPDKKRTRIIPFRQFVSIIIRLIRITTCFSTRERETTQKLQTKQTNQTKPNKKERKGSGDPLSLSAWANAGDQEFVWPTQQQPECGLPLIPSSCLVVGTTTTDRQRRVWMNEFGSAWGC